MVPPEALSPVIVVAGPTASGKSALAADMADAFSGVVINADSMQVYRGLEVLSAAPDADQRSRVPHVLYGILDPAMPCSAGDWRSLAIAEIEKAREAQKLPIIVGGTGLYLRTLISGIARMPPVPPPIRERVRARLAMTGSEALHGELAQFDPDMAATLAPGDSQRIARALEIFEATGRTLTDWQRGDGKPDDPHRYDFFTILLAPPRDVLYPACDARFLQMLDQGALQEVERLAERKLDPALPAMKALGVPHLLRHLSGEIPRDEACRLAQQATRRYVKRQTTWFAHQIIANYTLESQYSDSNSNDIFAKISTFLLTNRG
ncbi:MAG: tRNA (adenosine(37)-N6)-dimethylallyltransferase MiaA [Rhodospirillaceae bacterium]|jgi:tRNA dimethylallyltransferase|nr:tRNA (adenosine(37)-N6)-dimethylallyltransferase MiaA [Rhodospirillaceae bacterium]MBT5457646.1 tRNA (adenosine(37)-N6)-dimethylallyltransferase MiaA [Rhodospirillaceae bacterium]